jgi:hypothetical protein
MSTRDLNGIPVQNQPVFGEFLQKNGHFHREMSVWALYHAAALLILDVPEEIVVEEFLLSEGAGRHLILTAVRGLQKRTTPLVSPDRLRSALAGR